MNATQLAPGLGFEIRAWRSQVQVLLIKGYRPSGAMTSKHRLETENKIHLSYSLNS